MADVKYIVECDASGALKSIKDLDGAINHSAGQATSAGTSFGGLWKQFAIGQIAVAALHKGYAAFKGFVEGSVKSAIEAEQAENNLSAALEITGRTVDGNIQHYKKFAAEQMRATTYTDEQVMASQALLLQLTSLDQNGLDRATKGAMGLASTMGIDLHSATMMVTKAMEGNYGALGRVGIRVAENLTGEQKQAALLDQLNVLYGRSTAETNTFGGAVKQLTNALDEVQETVGGAIVKNESFKDATKDLKGWVDKLATSPDFQLWLNTVIDGMVAAAKFTGKFASACRDLMMNVFGATKADREMTEAQIKLNAALDRARAAGHDVDQVQRAIAESAHAAALKINEVGSNVGILIKETIKLQETWAPNTKGMIVFSNASISTREVLQGFTGTLTNSLMPAARDMSLVMAGAKMPLTGYAASLREVTLRFDPARAAMLKAAEDQKSLDAALKIGIITDKAYATAVKAISDELKKAAAAQGTFADKVRSQIAKIAGQVQPALNAIDAAIAASYNKKSAIMDNYYQGVLKARQADQKASLSAIDTDLKAKIDAIQASRMSEEEKDAAIVVAKQEADKKKAESEAAYNETVEGINAEYEIKRRGLAKKQAEAQRATAVANAIISIAEGAAKAWGQGGVFGAVLAAIVVAAGAILIQKIMSTPIPLATGAIFKKPAMLSSAGGNTYEVAEAGEAEILSSPRRLREAIMGKGARGGNSVNLTFNIRAFDGADVESTVRRRVIPLLQRMMKSELFLIHPRAVRTY